MGAAAQKKTDYIVLERRVIQRVLDPEQPEEYENVEAFIPVRGLGSGQDPMPANSGPEACRAYARERGGFEGEDQSVVELRAVSVRNWSGTDAGMSWQLSFNDVLPPPRAKRAKDEEPEPDNEPEFEPEADPTQEPVTSG